MGVDLLADQFVSESAHRPGLGVAQQDFVHGGADVLREFLLQLVRGLHTLLVQKGARGEVAAGAHAADVGHLFPLELLEVLDLAVGAHEHDAGVQHLAVQVLHLGDRGRLAFFHQAVVDERIDVEHVHLTLVDGLRQLVEATWYHHLHRALDLAGKVVRERLPFSIDAHGIGAGDHAQNQRRFLFRRVAQERCAQHRHQQQMRFSPTFFHGDILLHTG